MPNLNFCRIKLSRMTNSKTFRRKTTKEYASFSFLTLISISIYETYQFRYDLTAQTRILSRYPWTASSSLSPDSSSNAFRIPARTPPFSPDFLSIPITPIILNPKASGWRDRFVWVGQRPSCFLRKSPRYGHTWWNILVSNNELCTSILTAWWLTHRIS